MMTNFIYLKNVLRNALSAPALNKDFLIKIFIICISFSPIFLKAQVKKLNNNINCDSLNAYYGDSGLLVEKLPALEKSLAETENDFLELIDTTGFSKTIYIKLYVDTLGNAHCPIIIKGKINKKLDSLALNFVSQLKFTPGVRARKKFEMFIVVALYNNEVKETPEMIRKNGQWFEKEKR